MFSSRHFLTLSQAARDLELTPADALRYLWSYYGSRLGARRGRPRAPVVLCVQSVTPPLRVAIRPNGFDWHVLREMFVDEVYRVECADVHTIFDLGGNIGLASLYMARRHPNATICAVEPDPDNLALFDRNVAYNRVSVRLVAGAVGAADGHARFTRLVDPRQHSIASHAAGADDLVRDTVDVKVMSVPTLLETMGWSHLDILKIDVEGAEVDVFDGRPSWLDRVRVIVGEGHHRAGYTADRCREELGAAGFEVRIVSERQGSFNFAAERRG